MSTAIQPGVLLARTPNVTYPVVEVGKDECVVIPALWDDYARKMVRVRKERLEYLRSKGTARYELFLTAVDAATAPTETSALSPYLEAVVKADDGVCL